MLSRPGKESCLKATNCLILAPCLHMHKAPTIKMFSAKCDLNCTFPNNSSMEDMIANTANLLNVLLPLIYLSRNFFLNLSLTVETSAKCF